MKNETVKCIFIIPYFGKFPNYFELFLKSCGQNKDFEWLIFTDDRKNYSFPENVKVIYTSFDEIRKMIVSKFNFEISLDRPYKLCDYKPAYGYIFEDYIKESKFWGYCDVDMVFGRLSEFITDGLLENYDKLFCLGHLGMYRNQAENNRVFMSEIDDRFFYKESFQTSQINNFDEPYNNDTNIDTIFRRRNKRVYSEDLSANFYNTRSAFHRVRYDAASNTFVPVSGYCLFCIEDGQVWGYKQQPEFIREKFLYIHLQDRKMRYDSSVLSEPCIKVVPNRFLKLEEPVNSESIHRIRKKYINLHLIQYQYKCKKQHIKKLLHLRKNV